MVQSLVLLPTSTGYLSLHLFLGLSVVSGLVTSIAIVIPRLVLPQCSEVPVVASMWTVHRLCCTAFWVVFIHGMIYKPGPVRLRLGGLLAQFILLIAPLVLVLVLAADWVATVLLVRPTPVIWATVR
jgi:hypothetical protein